MRIKSYFAPSVQAAIALARKEFGDGVTLVTSHVASLDNRHLGEYEVVFAIEEVIHEQEAREDKVVLTAAAPVAEAPAPVFTQLFQQAIHTPLPMHENLEDKLEHIHASLVALGLDAALVRSFMTMLKAVLPAAPVAEAQPLLTEEPLRQSHERSDWSAAPEPVPAPAPAAVDDKPAPKQRITIIKPEAQLAPAIPTAAPAASSATPAASSATPRPFLSLFETARPEPPFSAAELAFMSSVSSSREQKA
jgi:hypothetical protein